MYGIITVSYTKALDTGDTNGDQVIPIDKDVYIAWADGPVNPSGLAAKHRQQPSTDFSINFGRPNSTCPPFSTGEGVELPPWEIDALEDVTYFTVDMGQAGGQQGYEGITGKFLWAATPGGDSTNIYDDAVAKYRSFADDVGHGAIVTTQLHDPIAN